MTRDNHATPGIQEPNVFEAHPEVFHYTSVAALKGILQTNELWATSTRHMNDSSELELIWPLVKSQIIEYLHDEMCSFVRARPNVAVRQSEIDGANGFAATDGQMLTSLMNQYFLGGEGGKSDRQPPFVVSFATHSGDSSDDEYCRRNGMLSQWRAYGGCDGVAIVFDTKGPVGFLEKEGMEFEYWPFTFLDAVYYNGERISDLFSSLAGALEKFSRYWVAEERDSALSVLNDTLADELSSAAARLKHRGFREERECRIVVGVIPESSREEFIAMGGQPTKSFKNICYRKGMCESIPYIRLFDKLDANLPIKRVIVGPSRNQRAVEQTVLELVEGKDVRVELSETPFVGSS